MSNFHVQTVYAPVSVAGVGNPIKRLLATISTWQQRYELRRHLLELDQHLLEDIGLSRAEVRLESAKPFWQE